jgi:hypothetical protein
MMESEFNMPSQEIAKRLTVQERLERVGLPEGYTARQAQAITKARMAFALAELVDRNVDNLHIWINNVAEKDPAAAVRLVMELTEYTMPRLKAAQIIGTADLTPDSGKRDLTRLTIAELQTIVAEQ